MLDLHQPRPLALFTGREEQREEINGFLTHLREGNGHKHPAILSFCGVGGVGKSTLCKMALAEFRREVKSDLYEIRTPSIAEVDLDSDAVKSDSSIPHVLVRVRQALAKAEIGTPLFDYLYLLWWAEENPGQSIKLENHLRDAVCGSVLDVCDLVRDLAAHIGVALPPTDFPRAFSNLLPQFLNWFKRCPAVQRFDGFPRSWSQRERSERMSVLLALDILNAIREQPDNWICLVIDGFERVQSSKSEPDAQWALATLVAEVISCPDLIPRQNDEKQRHEPRPLRGRIGIMIFGRERLRWAELYGRERVRTDWKRQIDDHSLAGLTEADSRRFLTEKAAFWERNQGRPHVAQLVDHHTDEILVAAAERLPDQPPTFLPYYLDLAILLVRDNAANFSPGLLGDTPGELERRFLRSLAPQHLRVLQVLALALEFDRTLFSFLLARGFVAGYASSDFGWLVGEQWSFVTPIGGSQGLHRFHRHMQASLIASLSRADEAERVTEIINALLDRLGTKATFHRPSDFGPDQEEAYRNAMDLLREHEAAGLLDTGTAVNWALRFEAPFEDVQATSLRRPALDWAFSTSQRTLEPTHPDRLCCMTKLADVLHAMGELVDAKGIQEQVLAGWMERLGETSLESLRSMTKLAATLLQLGDLPGARALQERALETQQVVLGQRNPDTLESMNNFAATLRAEGKFAEARKLDEQVLAIRSEVLGPRDQKTLASMNNLAVTLSKLGELTKARGLYQQLLTACREELGSSHPHTLATAGNLAVTLHKYGDLSGARTLLEEALAAQIEILGERHPNTSACAWHLMRTLEALGLTEQAKQVSKNHLDWLVDTASHGFDRRHLKIRTSLLDSKRVE